MKIVNKLVLLLVCLAVALVAPMLQVQADEDSDEYWYEVGQKYYENGELKTDITYHFTFSQEVFYFKNSLGDYDNLVLSYWTGENIMPVIIGENSYKQSNLSPYEKSDFSGVRNPTVNLFDGSYTYQGNNYSYVNDLGKIKLFSSRAAAQAYFEDGDDSGWENKPHFGPDITDARFFDPDCFLVNPIMNYTKGTSALTGSLSTFMGKKLDNGFYSYSSRNMKYTFLWESVNTSFEADLSLSYMRIDIICNDQVYIFSDSGYSLSSGYIEITLQDILSFLSDNDVQPVIESFSIRYTPFYMIGPKTYYGRSVRFLVQANSAGILLDSQGDDLYGSNSDYSEVDIVPPSDLPIVVPGFTDNDSFEFDFSYDADNMFKNFFNSLRSLISYCGQLPALINKVFSFLPDVYGNMFVVILAACFIMRLLGR